MSLNRVMLIGHLGKDPETRYMASGEAVANVSLATSESWKDKNGEKQERTEWHNLTFYRRLAEVVGEHLKKGALIYVEGKIQTRKWQTKEGQDRYTTEIIVDQMQMLGSKRTEEESVHEAQTGEEPVHETPENAKQPPRSKPRASFDNFYDDIPF